MADERVLTTKYRPPTFDDVIGQPHAVKMLKAIAKNPKSAPKSIVLHGEWGTGKTSNARIFARAMACEKFPQTGKVCGKCYGCRNAENPAARRYYEYDSAQVGNVQQVKDLKPVFEMMTDHYRVIVLDEAHLISKAAQSALLKQVEEGNNKTFFLFVSTDYDKILKTIHSRSIPVEFFKVKEEVMVTHLRGIAEKESDEKIHESILEKIAFKADGHVRDAVMLLNQYLIEPDEELLDVPIHGLIRFFDSLSKGDKERTLAAVSQVMKFPMYQVRKSMYFVVHKMVEAHVLRLEESEYTDIVKVYGSGVMNIFKMVTEVWAENVFEDKHLAYSFMLTLMKMFFNNKKQA